MTLPIVIKHRNTSPVTGRNSVFQNDNAVTNEINVEPPQLMSAANLQVSLSESKFQFNFSLIRLFENLLLFQNANPDSPSHKIITNANNLEKLPATVNNSFTESGPQTEQQLKYENERLKMALAQR